MAAFINQNVFLGQLHRRMQSGSSSNGRSLVRIPGFASCMLKFPCKRFEQSVACKSTICRSMCVNVLIYMYTCQSSIIVDVAWIHVISFWSAHEEDNFSSWFEVFKNAFFFSFLNCSPFIKVCSGIHLKGYAENMEILHTPNIHPGHGITFCRGSESKRTLVA